MVCKKISKYTDGPEMSLQLSRPAVATGTRTEGAEEGTEDWAEKDTPEGNTERSCYWCRREGRRDARMTPGCGSVPGHLGTYVP